MSDERLKPYQSEAGRIFGLTEREDLYNRVSHARFQAVLTDEQTTVHSIAEDSNNYGEFLFVSLSRQCSQFPLMVTFYGLGYHDQRERWITDSWFWYEANLFPDRLWSSIPKEKALKLIAERQAAIQPYVTNEPQSPRARLFELLADLTDEDGAYTEMEDLGDMADWLGGEE